MYSNKTIYCIIKHICIQYESIPIKQWKERKLRSVFDVETGYVVKWSPFFVRHTTFGVTRRAFPFGDTTFGVFALKPMYSVQTKVKEGASPTFVSLSRSGAAMRFLPNNLLCCRAFTSARSRGHQQPALYLKDSLHFAHSPSLLFYNP